LAPFEEEPDAGIRDESQLEAGPAAHLQGEAVAPGMDLHAQTAQLAVQPLADPLEMKALQGRVERTGPKA